MSRHTATTPTFNVCLGVDRPLSHVFAQVFLNNPPEDAEEDTAPGFNNFINFPCDHMGVDEAVHAVEVYVRQTEPNFNLPPSIQDVLKAEVDLHLSDRSASLNFAKNHGFVPA